MTEQNKTFRLTSEDHANDNKVLCVDTNGSLTYNTLDTSADKDNVWTFVEPVGVSYYKLEDTDKGYYIVSLKTNMVLNYNPIDGEIVSAVPLTNYDSQGDHPSIWFISNDSEIFTLTDENHKKYLWSIKEGVYVTPDEYLAEKWIATSLDGLKLNISKPLKGWETWRWILVVLLLFFIGWLIYMTKSSTKVASQLL